MAEPLKTVSVKELTPGMTIREINELSFDYATLDPKTVQFLKTNFKGATAVVINDAGRESVPMENLQAFDHLDSIANIPDTLKIASVVPGLARSMEKYGFLQFRVTTPAGKAVQAEQAVQAEMAAPEIIAVSSKQAHEARVEEVKDFLGKIEGAEASRDKSSSLVEEMLDQGRAGKFTAKGAGAAVEEILEQGASTAMNAVAGLKGSDQTYTHCVDMSVIFQEAYADILRHNDKEVTSEINRFTLISGFMHDIGKSEVPKEILESTVRFAPDSKEMLMLRNHTTYGARILNDLGMSKATINVAHYHHVKKDSTLFTSYPDISYDKVLPLTRLASVVDVYQALIGKRKYKRNWVPGKATEYLIKLRGSEFEHRMLDYFIRAVGKYPLGSLLRLSNNCLGFVVHIAPAEDPEKPVVVVVENGQGELLSHHQLIDLIVEPDVTVVEVVDHYEYYNESEDQAYNIFRSITLG